MTYKSKDKSFFDDVVKKEIKQPVQEAKEDLEKLEKKGAKKFLRMYDFGVTKLRSEIKKRPAQYFFLFITSFLGSVITSAVALFIFSGNIVAQFAPKPQEEVKSVQRYITPKVIVSEKYDSLLLASKLRKNERDFELIDVRSVNNYVSGHIVTSINLPIYGTSIINKDGDLDIKAVEQVFRPYMLTDKLLIIYAQNAYSTVPIDIATQLNSDGKTVKALAVGWEEWEHLNK